MLPDFLESTKKCIELSGHDLRIYAIDNASSDETLAILRSNTAVHVSAQPINLGVAAGNNIGIRLALAEDCRYVVLINNDTVFDESLINGLITTSEGLEEPVVVPLIYGIDPPDAIWFSGGSISRLRAFSVRHEHQGATLTDAVREGQTEYAPTCCMLIRRDVFDRVGLMDETFFVYADDTDFCLRLAEHGLHPYVALGSVMLHKASSLTGGVDSLFSAEHITRGRVLLARKHLRGWRRALSLAFLVVWVMSRIPLRREPVATVRARALGAWKGLRASFRDAARC